MIKINENSNIYMLCPANHQTGGTELAHQLVDLLLSKNRNAFIVYVSNDNFVRGEVPEGFRKYNIKVADRPIDDVKNVVICPESIFSFMRNFNNIQIVFWWMSVDNFFMNGPFLSLIRFVGILQLEKALKVLYSRYKATKSLYSGMGLQELVNINNTSLHVYQSTYAKQFLLNKNISELLPLSDYVNTEFLSYKNDNILKQNVILFNPAKGLKFTKKIIKALPSYKFVALEKMSREELAEYFKISKLYIDFGNHPGKDRLPREAALNDCCLIVGKKGSAKYFEDVSIPSHYKFDESDLSNIIKSISYVMSNYSICINEFQFYKKRILLEKTKFQNEVDEIFNL